MIRTERQIPFLEKANIALSLFRARFFKTFTPLLVGWSLTNRCPFHCAYCGLCDNGENELPTARVLEIIQVLHKNGCKRIQFTGGEPLLRDDLGTILETCQKMGIRTSVSTNGALVSDRINDLVTAGSVNISIDGPVEVHDEIRGAGSFIAAKNGVEALKNAQLPYRFVSVLTSANLKHLDFLLDLARSHKTVVSFQPATLEILGTGQANPYAPKVEDFRIAIDEIIRRHKQGAPIGNSLPALRYLRNWPNPTPILCVGGRIFVRIEANGGVVNCQRRGAVPDGDLSTGNVEQALAQVKNIGCTQCWSAPVVEAACIMEGKLATVLHLNRIL